MTFYRISLNDKRFADREGDMSLEDARELAVHLLLNANKGNIQSASIYTSHDPNASPRYYVYMEGNARYPKFTDYFAHGFNLAFQDNKTKRRCRLNFDGTINRHDRRL